MRFRVILAASALLVTSVLPALAAETGDTAMETDKVTIELKATNDSGESGTAVLTAVEGNKTQVVITVTGEPSGASEPAHIHTGKCPMPGAVRWPLAKVENGASTTTLDVSLAYLKSQLPLAINTHKSVTEVSVYMACGNFPGKKVAMKSVVPDCVKAAVSKRDDAVGVALDAKYAGLKAALTARKAALLAAWDLTDLKARVVAVMKAWKDDWMAVSKANKDFRTARNAAWKQFHADRKTCGPSAGAEDASKEGYDAQL